MNAITPIGLLDAQDMITVGIASQTFGIPVRQVQDVLGPQRITTVPLAPKSVAGVMNLRGRIVTAIAARLCLGLPANDRPGMFVVVAHKEELYGLMVDHVGEAITLEPGAIQPNPSHMEHSWRDVSLGIVRRDDRLIVILDIARLIGLYEGELHA